MTKFSTLCILLILLGSSLSAAGFSIPSVSHEPSSLMLDSADIPTWYPGDTWTYQIDSLLFSDENYTFTGTVTNCQFTVTNVTEEEYALSITAQIEGVLDSSGISGDIDGSIAGTSAMRRSDLAQGTTVLTSTGTISIMGFPLPCSAQVTMLSQPWLEAFDFPLLLGDVWQVQTESQTYGWFTISDLMNQSLDSTQIIDETVTCPQHADITVPAGMFDCFEVTRESSDVWYSEQAGNLVKSTINQTDENSTAHAVLTLQSYSRSSQPLTVTEDLQPPYAVPGASIIVSGHCQQTDTGAPVVDGSVTIEIPATGDVWTTTTDAQGNYTKSFTAPTILDDTPCGHETGSSGVVVSCQKESLTGYRVRTLTTLANTAPPAPTITGPAKGKPDTPYTFNITTTDAEDDAVYYLVDWGDDTSSGWVGPSASGEVYQLSHTFDTKGTFTVRAKAKDIYGFESDWSTLVVKMPAGLFSSHGWFFQRFPHAFPILRWLSENY